MKTDWNYSELAKPYLNRPDYSNEALDKLFKKIDLHPSTEVKVCDIGAGVAHLTIPILKRGFYVDAVEPNEKMLDLGNKRTCNYPLASWHKGTAENTGRTSSTYSIVTFGSSFNVTDRMKALIETNRILKPNGWFVCMWNHRNLKDPTQIVVEGIITKNIPNYNYGIRRENQTEIIRNSGLFYESNYIEGKVKHTVPKKGWVNAWRSHATLARQAGNKFSEIVKEIESFVNSLSSENLIIPYVTKIWFAQKIQ